MITKIYGGVKPLVHLYFDNGNMISIIWGAGTYSDNYDKWREMGGENKPYESTTVEIMVSGNKRFVKWFDRKYDGNPGGHIPVNEIPALIKKADSVSYAAPPVSNVGGDK